MPKARLKNKSDIEALPFAPKGKQIDYFDTELKGFGLRAGEKSKTFFVLRDVKGKTVRKTIGRYGVITLDKARKDALIDIGTMANGINPTDQEEAARADNLTLKGAFDEYLKLRTLKPTTMRYYKSVVNLHLNHWLDRPLKEITAKDVLNIRSEIMERQRAKKDNEKAGEPLADMACHILGGIWNFAAAGRPRYPENPVDILSKTKTWSPKERRSGSLKPCDYESFCHSLSGYNGSEAFKDAITLMLHTGLRRSEVRGLLWQDVSFTGRTFTAKNTKNGTDHTLPMSKAVYALFERRHKADIESPFVFTGSKGRMIDLTPDRLKRYTGTSGLVHDLRRSFASLCESLRISHAMTKRLVNHSMKGEITTSHMIITVDDMRPAVEKISAHVDKLISGKAAKVHLLDQER